MYKIKAFEDVKIFYDGTVRNGTGITIYLLYKHHFAETIQKLYWQNKFRDIVEAPVLYIEEWNNIHILLTWYAPV